MHTKRIRDYGITIGSLKPGKLNNIADVAGVTVGHCTIDNEQHKTGVTVIMPTPDNIFENKFIASSYVLNGFGKTTGTLQVQELGTLESPIALTNTLNVGLVQDAIVDYMVHRCASEQVNLQSFNPVIGECNDCHLNHICERAVQKEHVYEAIANATCNFEQGDVGAGKGTICFGFKGGIGSASRQFEIDGKTYTLGVLVQSNFGKTSDLTVNGFPLGEKVDAEINPATEDKGSIMSIIATDLPVSSRQLHRILKRAGIGLGRTGSHVGHGSGDVMIGFSTAHKIPHDTEESFQEFSFINEGKLSNAFYAVIEAEEEAVLNSMIAADTVVGYTGETRYSLKPYLERYLDEIR